MTLEVDGGFSNPYVLGAMFIWLTLLLTFLLPIANRLGRTWRLLTGSIVAIGVATGLIIPTQIARVLIGTSLYRIGNSSIVSVGFWGGSAPFLIPAIAAVCWFVVFARANRRARSLAA